MAHPRAHSWKQRAMLLGTAQMTWSAIIVIGVCYCVLAWWRNSMLLDMQYLITPARLTLVMGCGYLGLLALVHVRLGMDLRRGALRVGIGGLVIFLCNFGIVVAVVRVLTVDNSSGALLAGLASLLATLETVGIVSCLLLLLAVWHQVSSIHVGNGEDEGHSSATSKIPNSIRRKHWLPALFVSAALIAGLFYLDDLPAEHDRLFSGRFLPGQLVQPILMRNSRLAEPTLPGSRPAKLKRGVGENA